jgi:hypothetical protein
MASKLKRKGYLTSSTRTQFSIKVILFILVVLAIAVGMSFFSIRLLEQTSSKIIKDIENTDTLIKNEEWKPSYEAVMKILNDWSSIKKTWAIFIDHNEIDNIDEALIQMLENVKLQEDDEALVNSASLKRLVKHIPLKEALTLGNIF